MRDAAFSNSARASSQRPSFSRRSPRTAGRRWYAGERRLEGNRVHELEPGSGARGHSHGHRAIELHDRRRRECCELRVKVHDLRPVRLLGHARPRVAGGDRRFERIHASSSELFRPLESKKAAPYEDSIPERAVLIEKADGLSRWTDPRPGA